MTKAEQLKKLIDSKNPNKNIVKVFENIKSVMGQKGDMGDKGNDGHTPIKGKDYFTTQEIDIIISHVQSRVKDGKNGEKGDRGDRGTDGNTPFRGIDYWTAEDQSKIIKDILLKIPRPKDGTSPNIDDIINRTVDELKKRPIDFKDIKGTEELVAFLKLGGFRGGGGSSSGGGTPGGATTQLQYNNAGTFGGISTATFNGTTLSISGAALTTSTVNGVTLTTAGSATTFLNGAGSYTTPGGGGLTVGTTAITGGTVGRLLYEGSGNVLQENANLTFDTTNYLTVGSASGQPSNSFLRAQQGPVQFYVGQGNSNLTPTFGLINTNSGGKAIGLLSGTGGAAIEFDSAGYFIIGTEAKSAFTGGTLSGGTPIFWCLPSGNFGTGQGGAAPNAIFDVYGSFQVQAVGGGLGNTKVNDTLQVVNQASFGASTTGHASINIATGTAPTSPNNGDIWFDGTNLFMRIGGVTKTFTII